jgi:hypothetical protein
MRLLACNPQNSNRVGCIWNLPPRQVNCRILPAFFPGPRSGLGIGHYGRECDTGPAADSNGGVFVVTGIGGFDANNHDYSDTMLKLTLAQGKANRGSTTVRKA